MTNGSPHVLVVDDDRKLVGLLERSLRFEGFDVTCAHSGEAALAALREREPDLVLLDIGMPERDGIAVLQETRQVSDVAVVMLTARDEVRDKVDALDLGADDYVAKPFDIDELVARIRAVLRRRGRPALDRLSYADVRLDLGRREADRDGRALALTATEFDVLAHLLRYPRQVHTRAGLAPGGMGVRQHLRQQRRRRTPRAPAPQARRPAADPHGSRGRFHPARPAVNRLRRLRRPDLSIRVKLAVFFTVAVALILAGAGVVTYQLLRHSLLTEIERDVATRAHTFSAGHPGPPYDLDTFAAPDVFIQVQAGDGTVSARSANLARRSLPLPAAARTGQVAEVRLSGRPLMLAAAPLAGGGYVVVARSPVSTYRALATLQRLLTAVVAAAMLLTAAASWGYARAALRPIDRVVDAARTVRDSRDLTRRVTRTGPNDEVGRLADTFNAMLAELETAHHALDDSNQQLRRFLADCSHELRGPARPHPHDGLGVTTASGHRDVDRAAGMNRPARTRPPPSCPAARSPRFAGYDGQGGRILAGGVYRRCGCTDSATGRRSGRGCPRLVDPAHASWYFAVQIPTTGGRRRRLRRGGFSGSRQAIVARDVKEPSVGCLRCEGGGSGVDGGAVVAALAVHSAASSAPESVQPIATRRLLPAAAATIESATAVITVR